MVPLSETIWLSEPPPPLGSVTDPPPLLRLSTLLEMVSVWISLAGSASASSTLMLLTIGARSTVLPPSTLSVVPVSVSV